MKILVYSADIGSYDIGFNPVPNQPGITYIKISELPHEGWKHKTPLSIRKDPKREALYYKLFPDRVYPHDISIWVDSSFEHIWPLDSLIEEFILSGKDIAFCPHRWRTCIYEEAKECIRRKKDSPEVIFRHIEKYRKQGFPPHYGLGETGILIRKDTPEIQKFNAYWWEQIEQGSKRDQISLMPSLYECGITPHYFPYKVDKNPWFKLHKHANHERIHIRNRKMWFPYFY